MSPNKLSSCKMLLITEIKEVTSIKLVLRSTAVRNLTMWGGLFISWFSFCDCCCSFIVWFIKLLLYMLRIWEMPTRKVLECCKQSVKDDLVSVQKIKVPEEKQNLETWFMKLQKGTKFLQGIKQKATFVIFWKKRYLCLVQWKTDLFGGENFKTEEYCGSSMVIAHNCYQDLQ